MIRKSSAYWFLIFKRFGSGKNYGQVEQLATWPKLWILFQSLWAGPDYQRNHHSNYIDPSQLSVFQMCQGPQNCSIGLIVEHTLGSLYVITKWDANVSPLQPYCLQKRLPTLSGTPYKWVGEALCGCETPLCLHLQQRQRFCGESSPQSLISSGGIQWRPAGNAKSKSKLCSNKCPHNRLLSLLPFLGNTIVRLFLPSL